MNHINFYAIRAAGISCFIALLIIGVIAFMLPSHQLIHYLTMLGNLVGQSTTIGIFMVAAFPPLVGCIFYFFWRWLLK